MNRQLSSNFHGLEGSDFDLLKDESESNEEVSGAEYDQDSSAGHNIEVERGLAWFKLLGSACFLALGLVMMVVFFRSRNVFEIRARSAHLCMIMGFFAMVIFATCIRVAAVALFHEVGPPDPLGFALVIYPTIVILPCTYGSRAIRLAVVFNRQARKSFPALISERNHVLVCWALAAFSAAIPLYDFFRIGLDSPERKMEFEETTAARQFKLHVGLEIMLIALYPMVRGVDDIFAISPELRMVMGLHLLFIVFGAVARIAESEMTECYTTPNNIGFFMTLITFSVTIIEPMRRLHFDPVGSSDPHMARALARRTEAGIGGTTSPFGTARLSSLTVEEEQGREQQEAARDGRDDRDDRDELSTVGDVGVWTWESLADIPALAMAFEQYAKRALCLESVLFLWEVRRFQEREFEPSASVEEICAFQSMTRRFILDGASEEVNLSSQDKKGIIDLYNGGTTSYSALGLETRRSIFSVAYVEIRYMLEANLMRRFISTDDFARAHAEAYRDGDVWREHRM